MIVKLDDLRACVRHTLVRAIELSSSVSQADARSAVSVCLVAASSLFSI
jgi:hypothetical protein